MKNIYTLTFVTLILASCSTNLKQDQSSPKAAISSLELPLYKDVADIKNNNPFRGLKPGDVVYMTSDSVVENNTLYSKIIWGDSTAYAPKNYLLTQASLAVLIGEPARFEIFLYADKELNTVRMKFETPWALVAAGPPAGASTEVQTSYNGKPMRGYVPTTQVRNHPDEVELYFAYKNASGLNEQWAALSRYEATDLAGWINSINGVSADDTGTTEEHLEGEDVYAEGDAEYGDYYDPREEYAIEHDWAYDDVAVSPDEAPGTVRKYFVFEDGSEMSAEGYQLENSQPWRQFDVENADKIVKKVRFEVVLRRKVDLRFDFSTYYGNGTEYDTEFTKNFDDCELNTPYFIEIEDKPGAMIFCSVMRVSITTGDETAVATVSGSCGD